MRWIAHDESVEYKTFLMLNKAKKANVRGFDDIPENPTYFAHLWDNAKFSEINDLNSKRFNTKKIINVRKL